MKKGALELSISTIIIVVLGILMLIGGIILIKNISCSAINGVKIIDDNMKNQLRDIFGDKNNIAIVSFDNKVVKGINYGVAFAIKNNGGGDDKFSYNVVLADRGKCNFNEKTANSFIILGKESSGISIGSNEYSGMIEFNIPTNIENCNLRYRIDVKKGSEIYDNREFTVQIVDKSLMQSFC